MQVPVPLVIVTVLVAGDVPVKGVIVQAPVALMLVGAMLAFVVALTLKVVL